MMTTKAMLWFFFWMTILNIPTLLFFYSGNEVQIEAAAAAGTETASVSTSVTADMDVAEESWSDFDVADLFGRLSLGNIGQSLAGCVAVGRRRLADGATRRMACSYGTMKAPEEGSPLLVGLAGLDAACGQTVNPSLVDEQCSSEGRLFTEAGLAEMDAYFRSECAGRSMCVLPPPNFAEMLATGCAGELARDADLKVVFQSQCTSDTIRVPYTDLEVQKSHFGLGVVLIDVVVVISFYVFTTVVRSRQLEYIREFKLQSIQMSDFTVRVEGLPEDADYGENDAVLRA
jgi:hypothetical protein